MWKMYESLKNRIWGQFFTFITRENGDPATPLYCFVKVFNEIISIPDEGLFIVEKAYCITTYCPFIDFFNFFLDSLYLKSHKISDLSMKDPKEFFTKGFGELINQYSNTSMQLTSYIDTLLSTKYMDIKNNEIPKISSDLGVYKFPYDTVKFKVPTFKNTVLCEYFIEQVMENITLDIFYELLIGVLLEHHIIFASKSIPKISSFR